MQMKISNLNTEHKHITQLPRAQNSHTEMLYVTDEQVEKGKITMEMM